MKMIPMINKDGKEVGKTSESKEWFDDDDGRYHGTYRLVREYVGYRDVYRQTGTRSVCAICNEPVILTINGWNHSNNINSNHDVITDVIEKDS